MNDRFFYFGVEVTAVAPGNLDNEAVKSMWTGFTCTCGNICFVHSEDNRFCIEIGNPEKAELKENSEYTVNISENGIYITAKDYNCLVRGFLATMLKIEPLEAVTGQKEQFRIKCGEFSGAYITARRMIHFCVFPETTLFLLKRLIRLAAVSQYTHVVIEFWGMLKYDCLNELSWENAYTKEQILPIINEARELGLEPVPMFNMLGHASACRICGGKHVVLDQNPKLYSLFTLDGWSWNINNPEVVSLLRKVRAELYELFGKGEYFHIGCDEDYHRNDIAHTSAIPEYLGNLTKEIVKEGRRPVIWADMFLYAPDCKAVGEKYSCNAASSEAAENIINALAKETVLTDWQYDVTSAPWKTTLHLASKGFDVICAPWFDRNNCVSCVDTLKAGDFYGSMLTTWHTLNLYTPSIPRFGLMLGAEKAVFSDISDFNAVSAALLRRVAPGTCEYDKAGWMEKQISLSAWKPC